MVSLRRLAATMSIALAACASDGIVPDSPRQVSAMAIAPYAIHEECAALTLGDRLDYHFEASAPVGFSLYYKDGIAFVSPVSRPDVRQFSGVFQPQAARRYCLQWEAGPAGASVDYRVRLLRRSVAQ